MPLLLDRALEDKGSVKLSLYSSVDGALTGSGATFKSAVLFPGQRKPLFVAGPSEDKLPKVGKEAWFLFACYTYVYSSVCIRIGCILPLYTYAVEVCSFHSHWHTLWFANYSGA